MHPPRLLRVERALCALSVAFGAWTVLVVTTGGFVASLGPVRISSRNPWTPAMVAVVAGLSFLAVRYLSPVRRPLRDEWGWWRSAVAPADGRLRVLLIPAVLVALTGFGLDVAQWLRGAPLWVDEQMIAVNLRDRSFGELTGTLWLGQSAPFGWLVLQRVVLLTLGSGELALRLVPLLFGAATLATAAWIGQRWMGPPAAALLVLLCSLSQWLSHFRFEVKHYSADAFWALLLPALAVWAFERNEQTDGNARLARPWRGWLVWWGAAAAGQWLANGAVLVTPACAVLLLPGILRRHGAAAAARFVIAGLLWLASFGAHYLLSLQYTHRNEYLRGYWAREVPPESAGLLATIGWIGQRLEPLAANPAATTLGLVLWGCAAAGFAFGGRRALGIAFASVPLSAFLLAGLRVVPLYERFSLWIVPALYVGVALLFDAGLRLSRDAWRRRAWGPVVVGVSAAVLAAHVSLDILTGGARALDFHLPPDRNHGLDDRRAVAWLMARRQPGDALVSTRLGWPALWWYGPVPVAQPAADGRPGDGVVMYEVSHAPSARGCGSFRELFDAHRRVLVHVGFPDMPEGFHDLLLEALAPYGEIAELRAFASRNHLAVLERRAAPLPERTSGPSGGGTAAGRRPLPGCATLRPMVRW